MFDNAPVIDPPQALDVNALLSSITPEQQLDLVEAVLNSGASTAPKVSPEDRADALKLQAMIDMHLPAAVRSGKGWQLARSIQTYLQIRELKRQATQFVESGQSLRFNRLLRQAGLNNQSNGIDLFAGL